MMVSRLVVGKVRLSGIHELLLLVGEKQSLDVYKNSCIYVVELVSKRCNAETLHGRFCCRGWRVVGEDDMPKPCALSNLCLI
jgi:hypothetical protein